MGFWDELFGVGKSRQKVKRNKRHKEPKIKQGQRTRKCPHCGGVGEVDVVRKGFDSRTGEYGDVSNREMCGVCHYRGVIPY